MGYIVHASINEKGGITGGAKGDQTGKEICIRTWYKKPWNKMIICKDKALAKRAAEIAVQIANDNSYGYCQHDRWEGYSSLRANGGKVSSSSGDFDCSSFVLACYILAGLDIAPTGYTGNLDDILASTGKFTVYTSSAYTNSESKGQVGCVYLKEGSHVVMYLGKNKTVSGTISNDYSSTNTNTATKTNIKKYQAWLNDNFGKQIKSNSICGKSLLVEDGVWGRKTKAASVIAFQVTCNNKLGAKLIVDGCFGPKSKAYGNKALVKKGAIGTFVRIVEGILYGYGYYTGALDGIAGSGVHAGTYNFQKATGLFKDYKFGANCYYKALS